MREQASQNALLVEMLLQVCDVFLAELEEADESSSSFVCDDDDNNDDDDGMVTQISRWSGTRGLKRERRTDEQTGQLETTYGALEFVEEDGELAAELGADADEGELAGRLAALVVDAVRLVV